MHRKKAPSERRSRFISTKFARRKGFRWRDMLSRGIDLFVPIPTLQNRNHLGTLVLGLMVRLRPFTVGHPIGGEVQPHMKLSARLGHADHSLRSATGRPANSHRRCCRLGLCPFSSHFERNVLGRVWATSLCHKPYTTTLGETAGKCRHFLRPSACR